ncbi:hypothetical protein Daura_01835 [Dactylosporangium aurantiacum]|uniref:Uncharacterized protein n=1 Tax=Dactylosporangium aurantiacum TaxID=35754 RepID=A0A9Q9IF10_9ACTN|nr:hypothetical protein [Dactylosporangium aurantiacum]MDG6100893.1 hypothetical protein [Dactylosporangium aurantiacum]UWZ55049.1 hypothetical protein Daura_01835 [Dactylosporangium aurantiacum]
MRGLAERLDDIAGQAKLYDVTDRAIRGADRRRRTRRFAVSALSVLAVTCVIGAVSVLRFGGIGRPEEGPGRLEGVPPALVLPLLDTPARGSLAGDTAFQSALLDRVVKDPEAYGLPGDRSLLRVLFAGDLPGNRRLVLIAGVTARPRMIHLTGRAGTAARKLELTGWGDVEEPVFREEWRDDDNRGFALVFGPAGYDVSVSDRPRYLADGTVTREWQPEPSGYVMRDTSRLPPGLRVRISRGTDVFYEAKVASPGTKQPGTVDPNPLHGRGKAVPRAAQAAADALAYSSGLVGPGIRYVVLWSDDLAVEDPNGTGTGTGQVATVMALTPEGGGPYLTVVLDASPEPNARTHPTAEGVLGDPDRSLIVMRMPHFTPSPSATLQIVAPPSAVRAEVLGAGALLKATPLTNGVGHVDLSAPVEVTVRAFDAQGAVVAERQFTDAVRSAGLEPEVRGW